MVGAARAAAMVISSPADSEGDGRRAWVMSCRRAAGVGEGNAEELDVARVTRLHAVARCAGPGRVALADHSDDGDPSAIDPARDVDPGRAADDDARDARSVVDVERHPAAEGRRTAVDRGRDSHQPALDALVHRTGRDSAPAAAARRRVETATAGRPQRALGEAVVDRPRDEHAVAARERAAVEQRRRSRRWRRQGSRHRR